MATTAVPADRPSAPAAKRYIYAWGEGTAEGNGEMKDLLGGKGAGLAEMTIAGLPTPPGLHDHDRGLQRLLRGRRAAARTGSGTTSSRRCARSSGGPARASATRRTRSSSASAPGAKFSMPGMMDTVLNLGLNEQTLEGLIALTGNERFGWDAYRRFIQMFGRIVMDVKAERFDARRSRRRKAAISVAAQDTDLTVDDLKALVEEFKAIVREDTARTSRPTRTTSSTRRSRPSSPAGSASGPATTARARRSPTTSGPPSTSSSMVFGNMGDDSGTGVAFTRDPNTGERVLFGEYLTNAQGEDVVAGIRTRAEDRPDGDRHAGRLRRVPADRPAAREALPRRPGPRVHDREGPSLHAPDAVRQADRGGRRADRGRHGRRGHDHEGRGGRPDRAGPRRAAPPGDVRPGRAQGRPEDRQRPQRLARRGRRTGGLRRRRRRRVGRAAART